MKGKCLLLAIVVLPAILAGCSKPEEPAQTTPPPSADKLGTGQQFGYPGAGQKK